MQEKVEAVISCGAIWGVLVLLNCVPILASLDSFSHSITMESLTPVWWKKAKIHQIEHSPGVEIKLRNF